MDYATAFLLRYLVVDGEKKKEVGVDNSGVIDEENRGSPN